MIAPDPLLWLRDVLRERADVKSAEVERDSGTRYISLVLMDGVRLWVLAPDGYVPNGDTPVDWAYDIIPEEQHRAIPQEAPKTFRLPP